MKWAIEIQKTSLERRNLSDLLDGLGFKLIEGIEYPALTSSEIDACATAADAFEKGKAVRAAFDECRGFRTTTPRSWGWTAVPEFLHRLILLGLQDLLGT